MRLFGLIYFFVDQRTGWMMSRSSSYYAVPSSSHVIVDVEWFPCLIFVASYVMGLTYYNKKIITKIDGLPDAINQSTHFEMPHLIRHRRPLILIECKWSDFNCLKFGFCVDVILRLIGKQTHRRNLVRHSTPMFDCELSPCRCGHMYLHQHCLILRLS